MHQPLRGVVLDLERQALVRSSPSFLPPPPVTDGFHIRPMPTADNLLEEWTDRKPPDASTVPACTTDSSIGRDPVAS